MKKKKIVRNRNFKIQNYKFKIIVAKKINQIKLKKYSKIISKI